MLDAITSEQAVAQEWCDGHVGDTGQRGQGVLASVAALLHMQLSSSDI